MGGKYAHSFAPEVSIVFITLNSKAKLTFALKGSAISLFQDCKQTLPGLQCETLSACSLYKQP